MSNVTEEPNAWENSAARLAESQVVSRHATPASSPLDRAAGCAALLREAYAYFRKMPGEQGSLSPAAEWMLDNFYLVEQTLRQLREDMPKGFYRRLPKLAGPPLKGHARVYAISQEMITGLRAGLDMDRVTRFIRVYQRVAPLTIAELWALPLMLRLGILDRLTQAVGHIIKAQEQAGEDPSVVEPNAIADEMMIANCFHSLRTLVTFDWEAFFERLSRVDEVLSNDPAGIYAQMDFDTRDSYRKVIEELAFRTGRAEEDVAREAITLAREAQLRKQGSPRAMHVGFWLVDDGRVHLEAGLGYRPSAGRRLRRWLFGHPTLPYLGAIALLTLIILFGLSKYALFSGGTGSQVIGVCLFSLLPALAAVVNLINGLVTRIVAPRVLPKMDYHKGIPTECRTMVVVPSLLSNASTVDSLLRQLELHFLRNADPYLHFALLTDFVDAPQKRMPEDDALLEQAKLGIQALNKKYGRESSGPVYLFHRARLWNPGEDVWMGWERKRGKLVEFNHLLRGSKETSYIVQMGDCDILSQIKYVITLDVDTVMPKGCARRLIATLAHPLNRAEFASDSGAVIAGYTVLQPRVGIKPTSANRSLFARIFSGDTGVDLYTRAVSDVYQDLFGEGIFVGKGIYDVVAFERSLAGRVPENSLLSHDLFEGIHGRAALVTDVVLYEGYPPSAFTYLRRLHRWVRGDWQLLPWLFPGVPHAGPGNIPNELSFIDRWKILDNLRRSLRAPALLTLLVVGWLWLPGHAAIWTLAALLMSVTPLAITTLKGFTSVLSKILLKGEIPSLQLAAMRWILSVVFLPYESLIVLDAIVATLVRLLFSRKRLLQWTTSAHTIRLFGKKGKLGVTWKRMRNATLLTLGITLLVALIDMARLPIAVPLLFPWLASPMVAYWISKPLTSKQLPLSSEQRQRLHLLARRTWLFFESFVGPEDNWLPPDHFQEDPRGAVAHRTSPTNLGLLLLSTLVADDLGYIGPRELTLRLRATFETMARLERYRGHFLNWYDTRTLLPLPPRYVSTVDSGNLSACLVALGQGLQDVANKGALRWQFWQGLIDVLGVLAQVVEGMDLEGVTSALLAHITHMCHQVSEVRGSPERWPALLTKLKEQDWEELGRLLISLAESAARVSDAKTLRSLHLWSDRVQHQLFSVYGELNELLPWLWSLSQPPALLAQAARGGAIAEAWQALQDTLPFTLRLRDLSEACETGQTCLNELRDLLGTASAPTDQVEEALTWCLRLAKELKAGQVAAEGLLNDLYELRGQAEAYSQEMDFSFLFNSQRKVFHIGFNVATGQLDRNHYDLLASEARMTSFLAIAKGDVPQSHWLHLDRPFSRVNGTTMLLSWNGSMFEYLMPALLMREYNGTLLDQTHQAVVRRQIDYAHQKHVPWGISESGYYRFDAEMNYQYRGFGVPGLGRKRGLGEDLVVSPYASLIALPVDPQAVLHNIDDLIKNQMLGDYGFYEAIDYTRSRLPLGQESAIVYSYMAHHQGMSLLAMANSLEEEAIVHRFHADPHVQSVEMLLQEQAPQQIPTAQLPRDVTGARRRAPIRVTLGDWPVPADAPLPMVHFLSNGTYGVFVTSAGGGYSGWREVDLTRWRPDATLDDWGTWAYIRDMDSGDLWSAGRQPTGSTSGNLEVLFSAYKAEFRRQDHDISLRMEIAVAPRDDVEIRRITLTNHSDHSRHLAITSYGEVTLAPQDADRRHPAFNKIFIESEYLPELNALLFHRRPRSAEEQPIYLAHLLVVESGVKVTGSYESDRARFLGRGGTVRAPAALSGDGLGLSGTTGATLDPIMALAQEIELESHEVASIVYVTLAAGSRREALSLARRYQRLSTDNQVFDQARSQSEREIVQLGLDTAHLRHIQQLFSALFYPHSALRAAPEILAANNEGQAGLWPYAISGDYPILLVRIDKQEEMSLVNDLLQVHAYWRDRQIKIDLVILNLQDTGYDKELHNRLLQLIARTGSDAWLNRRGGIFLLHADQMSKDSTTLLETAARAIFDGGSGSLADQLDGLLVQSTSLPQFVPTRIDRGRVESTPLLPRPADLQFDNGLGGFSPDGREYLIYLEPGKWTPAPWINVIANAHFGFLASEAGGGYTWAENSGENRLTSWRNDPVTDMPSEALYLRDEETGEFWSPTPLPARADAPYLIRHGAGYSVYEHNSHGLKQRLRLFAVPDAPVKVAQLRLENTWNHTRRITASYYAEWVLGTTRDVMQQYIIPEFDATSHAMLFRNRYNVEFGQRVAFLAASREPYGLTADRSEFLGRMGSLKHPAALDRVGLTGKVEAGLDPCAAMQVLLWLAPGETKEVTFLLGEGANHQEALELIARFQNIEQVQAAWEALTEFWDNVLGAITVQTPDPAMNLLLNRWLLYQVLSCRVWGRSALYQSSGAFGYRDQLQDVMALLHAAPDLARGHILRTARRQFEEGDVLHWWHPPSGRGVRTRISDDLLWLPFVAAHYVSTTGDESLLREKVPFLKGEPLKDGEEQHYEHYEPGSEEGTIYEHCLRALAKGTTTGPHDLPLIGGGDWNDGMNRVGIEGQGESVWLGWFLYATLSRFSLLCERIGDGEQAAAHRQKAQNLRKALEANAWDGNWYLRAYYDDGTPLGSAGANECQIASIAQSWAVLSVAGNSSTDCRVPQHALQSMKAVADRLVLPEQQLFLLFSPPFDKALHDPGYIKGYPPGIRENGGQYTHAALWAVWAFAELGQGDRAEALFRLLNPIYHADTPAKMRNYRVEPYIVAADIYSVPPHLGRGGWTWYTGSASWMYRLGVEGILGVHRVGRALHIDPCISKDWSSYELTYRDGKTSYRIHVDNPDGVNRGVKRIMLDGDLLPKGNVPLMDDGRQHEVYVIMG